MPSTKTWAEIKAFVMATQAPNSTPKGEEIKKQNAEKKKKKKPAAQQERKIMDREKGIMGNNKHSDISQVPM